MQNLLDKLEAEQKRQLNRQSANEQLCHHFAGNAELPKEEMQTLSEQYGLACNNFCFDEKEQIEGFINGLSFAILEVSKLRLD